MTKINIKFRDCCLELLDLLEIRDTIVPEEFFSTMIHENKFLFYKPGYKTKLSKLVDYILKNKNNCSDNYSKEYLFTAINGFLFDLKFDPDKQKANKINSFFKSDKLFVENNPYIVTRQIVNLSLDSDLSIGKVTFIPYTREKHESIYTDAGYVFIDNSTSLFLHFNGDDDVGCIAKIEVVTADIKKAIELSDFIVEESLNVIRFYLPNFNFGTRGSLERRQKFSTAYGFKKNEMWSPKENIGIYPPVKLESNYIQKLRDNYGLTNIDDILKKESREDMEERLIISINCFSEILKHRENPENIIKLFTAMEALLLNNEEKKNNLAERMAFITHSDEKKRNNLYNLVKESYSKRSDLVHEGVSKYEDNKFNELLNESYTCIMTVAKMIKKYPKFSDWENLIKNAKFSCKLEFQ